MLKDRLIEQLNNDNHYTVPKYLLSYQKELGLNLNSMILLIYFLNQKNNDIFDYKKIIEDLNMNEQDLMEALELLKDKKYLSIEMKENESGILEERVNISSFYDIVFSKMLDKQEKDKHNNDLYSTFEEEFGRTLSPMEYEIINNWLEQNISEDLILAALKETVFNGINNLRYVDKILYEWNKKGIKNTKDVENKIKNKEESKEEDSYEYDWLNE